ncbi:MULTISPECIES: GDSL-type esterase/lipase family protein [Alteromonadaceae]|uniref:GDSL-type esterase/lipase family protein n=1 Tax=Alteromonadaceae TaxID=72275 RepID=UPI00319E1C6A
MKNIIDCNNAKITVMGRILRLDEGIAFSYPGVSISFNVQAKNVELVAKCSVGKGRIDVIINNTLSKQLVIAKTPKTFRIFSAKHKQNVKIELLNRGESWHGVINLISLLIQDGELIEPPQLPDRKLIFIGDSIVTGALMERHPNAKKGPQLANAYQSFGMQLGRLLKAQVHLIGFGGRGLIQGSNMLASEAQLPEIFPLTIPVPPYTQKWPVDAYIPDGIFICLGTNDFYTNTPDLSIFKRTYALGVKHLLNLYPDVQIMISEGPMLCDTSENEVKKRILIQSLKDLVDELKEPQLDYLACINCKGDNFDPHPTLAQHTQLARHFVPLIQQSLRWPEN